MKKKNLFLFFLRVDFLRPTPSRSLVFRTVRSFFLHYDRWKKLSVWMLNNRNFLVLKYSFSLLFSTLRRIELFSFAVLIFRAHRLCQFDYHSFLFCMSWNCFRMLRTHKSSNWLKFDDCGEKNSIERETIYMLISHQGNPILSHSITINGAVLFWSWNGSLNNKFGSSIAWDLPEWFAYHRIMSTVHEREKHFFENFGYSIGFATPNLAGNGIAHAAATMEPNKALCCYVCFLTNKYGPFAN